MTIFGRKRPYAPAMPKQTRCGWCQEEFAEDEERVTVEGEPLHAECRDEFWEGEAA